MKLAATSRSPIRAEGDAKLELVRRCRTCNIKFLADDNRLLVSVTVTVDEGHVVGFEPQESNIVRTSSGQRIPMCRKNGVFAVRLDSKARSQKKMIFTNG